MVNNLINDIKFKADFYALILDNRRKVTTSQAVSCWNGACKAMLNVERDATFRRMPFSLESVKEVVLKSAEVGLSLAKEDKEAYIGMSAEEPGMFRLGYAYRGLRRLMLSHPEARMISSSLIYKDDKFEWRGNAAMPVVSSDSRGTHVVGAYAWFKLKTGEVYCVMLTEEELLMAEHRDIERAILIYGDENQSFYRGHFRRRMFEIEAFKALYRHCADVLNLQDISGESFASASLVGQMD